MKLRLDKLLVDRGLAASRERAQALILAGRVLVDEQRVDKPGVAVADDAVLRMLGDDLRYVSRGGLKLEGWPALILERRLAASPTACCSTAQPLSWRSTLATDKFTTNCATTLA